MGQWIQNIIPFTAPPPFPHCHGPEISLTGITGACLSAGGTFSVLVLRKFPRKGRVIAFRAFSTCLRSLSFPCDGPQDTKQEDGEKMALQNLCVRKPNRDRGVLLELKSNRNRKTLHGVGWSSCKTNTHTHTKPRRRYGKQIDPVLMYFCKVQ